jgi:hypothetical protein
MAYLRIVEIPCGKTSTTKLDIFDGNIKIDKKYWEKYQNATVRYFKLIEVKI